MSYDDIKAKEKDDGTIVTNADIEINSLIKKILNCYPNIPILSEESEFKEDFLKNILAN